MKRRLQRFGLILIFLTGFTSNAQQDDVSLFVTDMLRIADDFASPAAEGAAYQAGAGWFTSAAYSGLWSFDFSVHANVLFIPESKQSTEISSSDFTTFDIRGGDNAVVPSAFGGGTDVFFDGELNFGGRDIAFQFQALEGVNKKVLMHPFLQATVGIPYGTDVTLRFLPQLEVDGVQFSTYGIGLKHNFNQYFFNPQPEDFQFAALLSYSKFDVNYEFTPVVIEDVANLREIEVDANLWLLQLITSKRFRNSGFSAFGALGATNSDFGYNIGGSGIALGPMNTALETLSNNEMEFKGDLGLTYEWEHILISSMFSQGKFSNFNFSLHYRL